MTLYSADIMDLATPVEKKPRKTKKEKVLPTPEPSEPEVAAPVAETKPEPKPKKEMTEKQKAALAKAQETRKKKKEEALLLKQKQEEEEQAKHLEEIKRQQNLTAKKEAAKEKRRLAKEKRKAETDDIAQEIDKEVKNLVKTPKPKKARVVRGEDPPAWFQKYIEGVKREQAHSTTEKKPVKQIQQEAQEEAKTKWDNGLVRDRLQNEVNGHMNRMYSMIFGSRNMR